MTRDTRVVNSGLKARRSRMGQGFPVQASRGTARWRVPLVIIVRVRNLTTISTTIVRNVWRCKYKTNL